MRLEWIFPTLIVGLNAASAICYFAAGNWKMGAVLGGSCYIDLMRDILNRKKYRR